MSVSKQLKETLGKVETLLDWGFDVEFQAGPRIGENAQESGTDYCNVTARLAWNEPRKFDE